MSEVTLTRECRVFTRALVGEEAAPAVVEAYREDSRAGAFGGPAEGIDATLLGIGVRHPVFARLADAYAAVFVRRGAFRTRLVGLLAILESGPPHEARFERVPRSPAAAWLRLVGWGIGAGLRLAAGTLLFGPIHLVRGSGRGGEAP